MVHKVVAIEERGVKARIVTKSPWYLIVLAHQVRSILWPLLKRDSRVSDVLRGDHHKAVENVFRVSAPVDGWNIISSDLTSASDTLPLDLIRDMATGLSIMLDLPKWMDDVLQSCVGPLALEYPDGTKVEGTCRGILMGLPTTWFFLCLVHLFWVEEACGNGWM